MAWVEAQGGKFKGRYKDPLTNRNHSTPLQLTRKAAMDQALAEEAKIAAGRWVDPKVGKITLDEYFTQEWFPHRILTPNARAGYWSHYTFSIRPTFGKMALNKITTAMVQAWITGLIKSGNSASTIRAKYTLLAAVFNAKEGASALRDKRVAETPCRRIQLPKIPPRDPEIYSPEQFERVVLAVDEWWRPLVFVSCETGLRWGELMALRPCDISGNYIRVRRTITEGKRELNPNGTRFAVKDVPKSGRSRQVALSPELVKFLKRLAWQRSLAETDLFFAMPYPQAYGTTTLRTDEWPEGLPPSRSHFRDIWKRAIRVAEVPQRRFHDLRATHISWLLAGGADVASVMRDAGHNQVSTTARYTAAMEDADQRTIAALQRTKNRAGNKAKKKAKKKGRKHAA